MVTVPGDHDHDHADHGAPGPESMMLHMGPLLYQAMVTKMFYYYTAFV